MKSSYNPILPAEYFVPDVEANVWNDGRIYLYGSTDIKGNMDYCRSTHASKFSRQVCAEPITFNADGTINEAPMTSSGAADSINADKIFAYSACKLSGNARIEGVRDSKHHLSLSKITAGDTADYMFIKFDGQSKVEFSTKSSHDMRIEIYVDVKYHSNTNKR